MQSEHKTIVGVILVVILLLISMPFEKRYNKVLNHLAQEPATRLFAGLVVLYMAYHDIMLGALAFMILFLWMSDIHLLSSLKMI